MIKRKKPFPSKLITLALLALIGAIAYFACYLPSDESVLAAYEWYGKLVCDYDTVFIVILIVVSVVEFVSFVKYGKRDEAINH